MGFGLAKLIGGLLMPLSVVSGLLILGTPALILTRYKRIGAALVIAGTMLLVVLSLPYISERALSAFESGYEPLIDPPRAEWIVVLGGGARGGKGHPPASRLAESSLYRLAEGVRIAKRLPDSQLVTSGGSSGGKVGSAELMAAAAAEWGVATERIVVHREPLNTAAEARSMAARVKENDTVILVTSAFHMRRAEMLFKAEGITVVPAPTHYLVDPDRGKRHIGHQLPQSGYIRFAECALWEWMGLIWARLRW